MSLVLATIFDHLFQEVLGCFFLSRLLSAKNIVYLLVKDCRVQQVYSITISNILHNM
jgi:hypothetical protein